MKRSLMFMLCACLTLVACQKKIVINTTPGEPEVLAVLNDQKITIEDIRKSGSADLTQAESQYYAAKKDEVDALIDQKLLEEEAKSRQVAVTDLLKSEVFDKVKVGDSEISKFYNDNKVRMKGKNLDDVKAQISQMLGRQKQMEARATLLSGLRKKNTIKYLMAVPRATIDVTGAPHKGSEKAPITLVEFTDYECPFCGRVRPTISELLDLYGKKINYVLMDFPLSFHKESVKAHQSAYCAGEQGKYWEMNKVLFENQRALQEDKLKKYAKDLGLKEKDFEACLASSKYVDQIQKHQEMGASVGVSGTPAFFINGRMLSGARPVEQFKEIIDDELSLKN